MTPVQQTVCSGGPGSDYSHHPVETKDMKFTMSTVYNLSFWQEVMLYHPYCHGMMSFSLEGSPIIFASPVT